MAFGNLGKAFILTGVAGGPICFFCLPEATASKNREFEIKVELGGAEGKDGSILLDSANLNGLMYQGFPVGDACFGNRLVFDDIYKIQFKQEVEGIGSNPSPIKGESVKGSFDVSRWRLLVRSKNRDNKGQLTEGQGERGVVPEIESDLKKKMKLLVYGDEKGVGILLFGEGRIGADKFDKVQNSTASSNGQEEKEDITDYLNKHAKGKRIVVRRSVIGAWSKKKRGGGCEETDFKKGNVLYKNFGVLMKGQQALQANVVLDWMWLGEKGAVRKVTGDWMPNGGGWGRYDYFASKNEITNFIFDSLENIRIDKEGMSDSKGNQVKWSASYKPSFISKLKK